MVIDITPIVQAVISLLAVFITAMLIPWIKAKTTAAQQATLKAIVEQLVLAAEQLLADKTGKDKMTYVQNWLKDHGYSFDAAIIEATVREMNIRQAGMTEVTHGK